MVVKEISMGLDHHRRDNYVEGKATLLVKGNAGKHRGRGGEVNIFAPHLGWGGNISLTNLRGGNNVSH